MSRNHQHEKHIDIKIRLIIPIILLSILIVSQVFSQDKPIRFDRLSTKDGLSQNKIFDVVQDSLGFIWIGTEDGLNRYDGYSFKVFKNIPGDSTSLSRNLIETLHIDKRGDLWIGGQLNGLSKFNYETESFTNYKSNHFDQNTLRDNWIIDISEDAKGNLWLGTNNNGVDYLDVSTSTFYRMENLLPPGYLFSQQFMGFIHQDREGYLWIGGLGKLHIFKVEYAEKDVPRLKPIKVENQDFQFGAASIEEDHSGQIWIGTIKEGIYKFDRTDNMLIKQVLPNYNQELSNTILMSLDSDSDDNLWFGGLYSADAMLPNFLKSYGAYKWNRKENSIQRFQTDPQDDQSLSENNVFSLYIDRSEVVWIGSFISGLNRYDRSVVKFNLFEPDIGNYNALAGKAMRGFYEEGEKLWIATATEGLAEFNTRTKIYKYHRNDPSYPNSIGSNLISTIYDDGKNLWIGTLAGLNKFDTESQKFYRYYVDSTNFIAQTNSINYNIIKIEPMPGYLWFGTNGAGLVRFNKKDKSFKKYTYDPETENSLNNRDNFVRVVWYSNTRPNEIWVGATHGINILNIETETFRYYEHVPDDSTSLSHQNVMNFYEDEEGYVWVSTYGGGLNRFDPTTEKFKRFTESNSDIPNNGVYGVLPDDDGNLWLSTNNGISKFNPNTFTFRNYSVDDGLQSEEFNGGSLHKGSSGRMYFGGINGFNSFFPADVIDNDIKPQIVITDLKIFNESIEIGEDSPLSKPIEKTSEVTLAYWQNDISFEYVGLHFANPMKNKYAFKLENYENEWRYVNNIRIATYTNLDPGEYVFRVKGSNNDGLWNEEGKSIKLTVLPPWWKTNWAYLGYGLLMLGLIFGFDRVQRYRLLKKEQQKAELAILEAENKRKSEELEEARQLQLSMLPKDLPQLPHLDIAVFMKTATEVGGDYYDFNIGMDGTLTVVLGDATGHGMKAGTMVTTTKSLFNVLAPNPNIIDTFHEMTRCLKLMHLEKLSMCMTMLKIAGSKIQMSAAGMPPVYIYKRESQSMEEHVMKGMPLGTFSDFPYSLIESDLKSGDTILMMSDGFPELMSDNKEMYGYKRTRALFEEIAGESPEDIISKLKHAGTEWVNDKDPDDDVTFVVIKVK